MRIRHIGFSVKDANYSAKVLENLGWKKVYDEYEELKDGDSVERCHIIKMSSDGYVIELIQSKHKRQHVAISGRPPKILGEYAKAQYVGHPKNHGLENCFVEIGEDFYLEYVWRKV